MCTMASCGGSNCVAFTGSRPRSRVGADRRAAIVWVTRYVVSQRVDGGDFRRVHTFLRTAHRSASIILSRNGLGVRSVVSMNDFAGDPWFDRTQNSR